MKKMISIGIYNGKNAGVSFNKNDNIFNVSEERFTRVKNQRGFPIQSLNYLCKKFKIGKFSKINLVTGAWNYPDESIIKNYFETKKKNSHIRLFNSLKTDHENLVELILKIKDYFPNSKITFYDHHLSHFASSLFFYEKRKEAYGIVADGRGSLKSISIWKFQNGNIQELISFPETKSLGAFYGSITYLLGFTPDKHEGKITGLAAFGKRTNLINEFEKLISFKSNKLIADNNFIPFIKPSDLTFLKKITNKYKNADIAFAAQYVLEKNLIKIINKHIPKNKLLLASGGVFANVKLNQRIRENCKLKNFIIFPEMSDGGISYGSLALNTFRNKKKYMVLKDVYNGPNFKFKPTIALKEKYNILHFQNIDRLSKKISQLIFENNVIGIIRGNMEYGPRALGNRSIICLPTKKTNIDNLNKRLGRNEFMPFAPVLLNKNWKYLFKEKNFNDCNLNFMTTCYNCSSFMINNYPSVVHVDNTARPQVLKKNHPNKLYYKILENLDNFFKIKCLINTSFNTHDEPIVCNPDEGLNNLDKNAVDFLIIDNYLIAKK